MTDHEGRGTDEKRRSEPGILSRRGLLSAVGGLAVGRGAVGTVLADAAGRQPAWARTARLSAADARQGDGFGSAVAVAGDRALVGAPATERDGVGAAYVFAFDGDCWHVRRKLTVPDFDAGAALGSSVALAADGTVALVGAPDAGQGNRGAAAVFRFDGTAWTETAQLTPNERTPRDFGTAVALGDGGRTALVGAPVDGRETDAGGAAFVFSDGGGNWTSGDRLEPGRTESSFGSAVALDAAAETAVVGAPGEDEFGLGAGTAWAFERTDGWERVTELPHNRGDSNRYGSSVALDATGDGAVIGAPVPYPFALLPAGYASRFVRSDDGWTAVTRLQASDGENEDQLGSAVALDAAGDTVLAGDPGDDRDGSENVGSVSVFGAEAGWTEDATLAADDGRADDAFGTAVALTDPGTTAVVGAPAARVNGLQAGAAYVFAGPGDGAGDGDGGDGSGSGGDGEDDSGGDTDDGTDDGTEDDGDGTETGPRTVMIAANEGGVDYRLTVDGEIESQSPAGDFSSDGNEDVTEDGGTVTASGLTGPAPDIAGEQVFLGDRFLFTGSVETLELDPNSDATDVTVYLDEASVAPADVRGFTDESGVEHTLMIAANEDGVEYSVTVDGTLDPQTQSGDFSAEATDDVSENDDGTVSVSDVTGPAPDIADEVTYLGDRFLVTGEVVDLTLDPGEPGTDVNVYLDEERVAPAELLD